MRHIAVQISTDLVTNVAEALVVEVTWVSTETGNDQFGLKLFCLGFKSIIVDQVRLLIDLVKFPVPEQCRR